jgi:alpha-mannosidase
MTNEELLKKKQELEKELQSIINDWHKFVWINGWTLKGKSAPKKKSELVNSGYPKYDPTLSDHIFRKEFVFPEKFYDMSMIGSKIDIKVGFVPGGQIYINGKLRESIWYVLDPNLTLTENLQPGEKVEVKIFIPKSKIKGGFGGHLFVRPLGIEILKIETFLTTLQQIGNLVTLGEITQKEHDDAVASAVKNFNWLAIKEKSLSKVIESIESCNKYFSPFSKSMKKFTMNLVGHAHIDMNWLWDWPETLDVCRRTYTTVNKLMDLYPDFKFSQSQAGIYMAMEKMYPSLFEMIKKRVAEGRWDITASTWTEGDVNMSSGESLTRHGLYAKRYIREKFGKEVEICWCGDTFGHPVTYPQILKKLNVKYYYACRCGRPEYPVLKWVSPEGSSVIVFDDTVSGYASTINPGIIGAMFHVTKINKFKNYPITYGVGDHGGGPTMFDLDSAKYLNSLPHYPNLTFSKSTDYFKTIENETLPVWKDELNYVFEGCYTSQSKIKLINRQCENMLYDTEVLSVIGGGTYQNEKITAAWHNTLFNQFHDIFDGSGIHETYPHSYRLFKENVKIINDIQSQSVKLISKNVQTANDGEPIVVFNTLAWDRTDVVESKLKKNINGYLVDSQGKQVPFTKQGNIVTFAATVPSLGYATYYWKKGEPKPVDSTIKTEDNPNFVKVDNKFYTIVFDKKTGTITSFFNKQSGKELVTKLQPMNTLQVCMEVPHGMTAWEIGLCSKIENLIKPDKIKLVSSNPVYTAVRTKYTFNKSVITQEIYVYADVPRVDFKTFVNWKEKGWHDKDSAMLRVLFPTKIVSEKAAYEIPYGSIDRITDGGEYPAIKWVDLSDSEQGLSLMNDSKHGYSVQGNTMRLTLLRSSYDPDPIPEIGRHKFTYSIYAHKNGWREAETVHRASELNNKLLSFYAEPGNKGPWQSVNSFVNVDKPNVIVSALKKHEYSDGLIVRVYESAGRETSVNIKLNFGKQGMKYKEVDLEERNDYSPNQPAQDGTISTTLKTNEIKTFLITFQ